MNISSMHKKIAVLGASALAALAFTAAPTVAHAAPLCDGKVPVNSCVGATSDGAPYSMIVPANFNGTVYLYSHGYRYNVDIPSAIPLIGGYKVTNTPQPGPNATVIQYLLGKGYAVMGSGFARQGWNGDSGVATDVELINTFKTQFTQTTHVIAWGESLGGFITQGLAEKLGTQLSAAAPLCMASSSVEAELKMAGDFLWGLKTFFDPSIKAGHYSAGAAGYAEAMTDLGKVFTVMGKLQAGIGTELATGKPSWPDTTPASVAASGLGSVPSRSALLLIGLMAGLPTQSAHFDGTTGPGSVNSSSYTGFALLGSPALGVLENGTNAAALAILATLDVEQQSGGAIFDNTKTDYAAQVSSEASTYSAALSGSTATGGMLAYLAAAPRAAADPAALVKMRSLLQWTGKISVPTVTMVGVADPITPAGNSTYLANQYATQYAAQIKANLKAHVARGPSDLVSIYGLTPTHYTTFGATGSPDVSTPAANGTNHCNFTTAQYKTVADLLAYAATHGKNLSGGPLLTAVRKMGGSTVDSKFQATLPKFYSQD
jgi:pimeloyl-ACP methyl ester carboxylesterase